MSKVFLVQGLGYGDEGKGSVVDHLVRQEKAPLVVRFNGGAQAAHNVCTDDGRHHTFAQFGSGTFAGARTFLSRFMLFNPLTLLTEAKHLEEVGVQNPLSLLTVEDNALVTSPFHMAANRIREILRAGVRHGSCGMGVGETVAQHIAHPEATVLVSDLARPDVCRWKLRELRKRLIEELGPRLLPVMTQDQYTPQLAVEWEMINDPAFMDSVVEKYQKTVKQLEVVSTAWLPGQLATKDIPVVFEGAQGVLLDQDYGWAPYNTWTDCTFANAQDLISSTPVYRKIGVVRGYMTRHGAGPLVTEDPTMSAPGDHNCDGPWQQAFRCGPFDLIAIRYAIEAIRGVHHLAVTCLDHLKDEIRSCKSYDMRSKSFERIDVRRPEAGWDQDPYHLKQQHRQEEMGKILSFLKPSYETLPDVESFLTHVEREIRVPIKLCSFGPKASDKRPR